MQVRGTAARGYRIHRYVSRVRYGTSLALHLGDIHSDHPADLLAFSVIVYLVVRSNLDKIPIPILLGAITEDATYYFMVIFTSHFVLAMSLAFGSVRNCRNALFALCGSLRPL